MPHPDAKGVLLHQAVIRTTWHMSMCMLGHPASVQMAVTGHRGHPGAHILNKASPLISSSLTRLTMHLFPATNFMFLMSECNKMRLLCQSATHLRISYASSWHWKSHCIKSECVILVLDAIKQPTTSATMPSPAAWWEVGPPWTSHRLIARQSYSNKQPFASHSHLTPV